MAQAFIAVVLMRFMTAESARHIRVDASSTLAVYTNERNLAVDSTAKGF
jgi:hypothetical protein